MNEDRLYRVRMQINIEQLDPRNGSVQYPGGWLLTQDLEIKAGNFLEIAHALGRFYELAETIKTEQAAKAAPAASSPG